MMTVEALDLPPGFRFHPTDEEIITHYLFPKALNHGIFSATAIGEVNLNKCEPWDLSSKAKLGDKEWYFFCQKDRKYPTGMRTNRATESGYWKATGKDKEIFRGKGVVVGMKKTLVFYIGRAPKGAKTNWVMHEFRLQCKASLANSPKEEWVVARVFHKKSNPVLKRAQFPCATVSQIQMNSLTHTPNLPPLTDTTKYLSNPIRNSGYQKSMKAQNPFYTAMKEPYYIADQFSNQSMPSQGTADPNTEISSSVLSKIDTASCASYDGGMMDLTDIWWC